MVVQVLHPHIVEGMLQFWGMHRLPIQGHSRVHASMCIANLTGGLCAPLRPTMTSLAGYVRCLRSRASLEHTGCVQMQARLAIVHPVTRVHTAHGVIGLGA